MAIGIIPTALGVVGIREPGDAELGVVIGLEGRQITVEVTPLQRRFPRALPTDGCGLRGRCRNKKSGACGLILAITVSGKMGSPDAYGACSEPL